MTFLSIPMQDLRVEHIPERNHFVLVTAKISVDAARHLTDYEMGDEDKIFYLTDEPVNPKPPQREYAVLMAKPTEDPEEYFHRADEDFGWTIIVREVGTHSWTTCIPDVGTLENAHKVAEAMNKAFAND